MNENLNEVEKLEIRPFTRFCMSIGAVPSSYLAGLSIEEQLLWLCSYLEKEVIPTVNGNAEAVEELQGLYVELKTYVDNYFDNLDVQDEINNKLDKMATDGTLDAIINQEIFGELNTAINTINNTTIPNIQGQIDTINNTTIPGLQNTLNEKIESTQRNALYIGNSYCGGVGSTNNKGIFALTNNMFNKAWLKAGSGTGFLSYTDHATDTFLDLLNNAINDSSIPNDEITDVIIIGACGDSRALRELGSFSTWSAQVQTAIATFRTTCENNFPNLKRLSYTLAESRGHKNLTTQYEARFYDTFWVHNRFLNLLPKNGVEYLGWIGFNILLDTQYFSNDYYHPNNTGYMNLATLFKAAYNGNFEYKPYLKYLTNVASNITNGSTIQGQLELMPTVAKLQIFTLSLGAGTTPAHNGVASLIDFGSLDYTLPMPTTFDSTRDIGSGFSCSTQPSYDAGFNFNNNYNGKLQIALSENDSKHDSAKLQIVTMGNSKTIASTTNTIVNPILIEYPLTYPS